MKTIVLKNNELEVHIIELGAAIQKIIYHGVDCVLGYDDLNQYAKMDANLGANCGRVANRIAKGEFTLNHHTYHLAINNGPNSLHGGAQGFHTKVFQGRKIDDSTASFYYRSTDGEENYPGCVDLYIIYRLIGNTLKLNYLASTTRDTIINLTNHSYFNLSGKLSDITTHTMQIDCKQVYPVDQDGLIQNLPFEVVNTPFDYNQEKYIEFPDDPNLKLGNGYDHFFILKNHQAKLYSPESNIEMTVNTSYPGAQIYSANYLTSRKGKYNQIYSERKGVCIECSYLPDSIHIEKNPQVILKKGAHYDEWISYTFDLKKC